MKHSRRRSQNWRTMWRKNLVRASTSKMAKSRQHMLDRIERIDKPLMYSKPPKIKLEYDIEPTKDIVRVVDCPLVVGEVLTKRSS